ncbi:MAG: CPBP family intramembrane metalloprotease [Planctomycetes bacterium]|nr:CPBP family intramembrane metalloprotease [Planctomycetota bacterium]
MHYAPEPPDHIGSSHTADGEGAAPAPVPTPGAVVEPANRVPTGRAVWWEVAAVMAVSTVPAMTGGLVSLCDPVPPAAVPPLPYWLGSVYLVVISGCTILVTLYLIGRSGESWERFGLAPPRVLDAPLGAFLLVVALVVWSRVPPIPDFGVRTGGQFVGPHGPGEYALMVVKYALAGFAEELVTRAYLLTRLTVLLRSRAEAVLFAALVFAACHAYQGPVGVVHSFVFGVTYGVIFLALGRVWPLAVGHALYNIRLEILAG